MEDIGIAIGLCEAFYIGIYTDSVASIRQWITDDILNMLFDGLGEKPRGFVSAILSILDEFPMELNGS